MTSDTGESEVLHYYESQKFTQWWMWLLIFAIALYSIYGFVKQVLLGIPFAAESTSDVILIIIAIVFGVALPVVFVVMKLETAVRSDGIYFRYYPLHQRYRVIHWEDVKKLQAMNFRPIRDFGGWGIRSGSLGKAYTISGNMGIRITLVNGDSVVLGSHHPHECVKAVKETSGRSAIV